MSNAELLAEAREKYPIGTIVKGMTTGKKYTVKDKPFIEGDSISVDVNESDFSITLYYGETKEWAEIITDWQPKEGEMVMHPDKICPIDMPSVGVKKGDVFKWDGNKGQHKCVSCGIWFPLELVETWESVPTEEDFLIDLWEKARETELLYEFLKYAKYNYSISRK